MGTPQETTSETTCRMPLTENRVQAAEKVQFAPNSFIFYDSFILMFLKFNYYTEHT